MDNDINVRFFCLKFSAFITQTFVKAIIKYPYQFLQVLIPVKTAYLILLNNNYGYRLTAKKLALLKYVFKLIHYKPIKFKSLDFHSITRMQKKHHWQFY